MRNQSIKIVLQTTKLPNGQYHFIIDVYDPFNHKIISDQVDLQFLPIKVGLIIQTDKDIYKPDDLIRFRLFGLDGDSRPVNIDEETQVFLIDPQGFALSTITQVAFSKGHYKNEFQLSNLVSTGFWTIRVQVGEEVCFISKQLRDTDYIVLKHCRFTTSWSMFSILIFRCTPPV